MLFFGLLLYIIENSEVESNTRNLLGRVDFISNERELLVQFQMDFGWHLLH